MDRKDEQHALRDKKRTIANTSAVVGPIFQPKQIVEPVVGSTETAHNLHRLVLDIVKDQQKILRLN